MRGRTLRVVRIDVETNRVEFGGEPLRGGADALERGVQRVGRAAVGLDVFDGRLGAGDTELRAEQVGDRFGLGLAGDEIGAVAAVGGEVQQHVRGFVGERGRGAGEGGRLRITEVVANIHDSFRPVPRSC